MNQRFIKLENQEISYELKSSRAARNLRLEIGVSGLKVIKPWLLPDILVERFIKSKSTWIIQTIAKSSKITQCPKPHPDDLVILKRRAAKLLISRLEFFNLHYKYKYSRLTVRDQKTRWGSCSRQGSLSFNYRLALLPEVLLDYVAVHELCHLKEMNHSDRFWNLVGQTIVDYKERRKELKNYRSS